MPETSPCHVFVYGTLRRSQCNDITRLQPAPHFVGTAAIRGTMFHLGSYPGVVLGGDAEVHGEVYAIDEMLLRELDAIEEVYPQCSGEYGRREITVCVQGQTLHCLVYEVNPARVVECPRIEGGDWVAHTAAGG